MTHVFICSECGEDCDTLYSYMCSGCHDAANLEWDECGCVRCRDRWADRADREYEKFKDRELDVL